VSFIIIIQTLGEGRKESTINDFIRFNNSNKKSVIFYVPSLWAQQLHTVHERPRWWGGGSAQLLRLWNTGSGA